MEAHERILPGLKIFHGSAPEAAGASLGLRGLGVSGSVEDDDTGDSVDLGLAERSLGSDSCRLTAK